MTQAASAAPVAMTVAAVLAGWLGMAAPVVAQAESGPNAAGPLVCRQGRVEMIVGGAPDNTGCETQPARGAAVSTPTSASAHKVPLDLQRERDDERRRILQAELDHEETKLAHPRGDADAQATARTRDNVLALRREIERLPPMRKLAGS